MTAIMDGQGCLFDPVTASGKTYLEPYPATTEKTSKPSSRSSQGSGSRTLPMCLCLRRGNGPKPGASTMNWGGGPLPIASMTHSIGEFRSDADGFLSLPISTDSQRRKFYLTLNCGEKPRIPNPTKLSEILVENPDEKYRLSAKACQGILNRAERRGKELPPELKAALEAQSLSKSEPVNLGGAKESSSSVSTLELSQPSTTRAYSIQGNTIDRDAKQNGGGISLNVAHTLDSADRHGVMAAGFSFGQSEKAGSLGYEKEKSPTIRGGEGGNQKPVVPAFAQNQRDEVRDLKECSGSLAAEPGAKQQTYVMAVDCRNGTESPDTNGTLQAKDGGGTSLNLNNVVRTSGGGNEPMGRTERENLRK